MEMVKPADRLATLMLEGFDPEEVERLATASFVWKDDAERITTNALRGLGMVPVFVEGRHITRNAFSYILAVEAKVGSYRLSYPWSPRHVSFTVRNAIAQEILKAGLYDKLDFDIRRDPDLVHPTDGIELGDDDYYVPGTKFSFGVTFVDISPTIESQSIADIKVPIMEQDKLPSIEQVLNNFGWYLGSKPLVHLSKGSEDGLMHVTAEFPIQNVVWKRRLEKDRWALADRLLRNIAKAGLVPASLEDASVYNMNPLVDMLTVRFEVEGSAPEPQVKEDQEEPHISGIDPEEVEAIATGIGAAVLGKLAMFKQSLEDLGFVDVRVGIKPTDPREMQGDKFSTTLYVTADTGLAWATPLVDIGKMAERSGFGIPDLEHFITGPYAVRVGHDEQGNPILSFTVLLDDFVREWERLPPLTRSPGR